MKVSAPAGSPPSPARASASRRPRRRLVAWAGVALLLALLLALGGWSWQRARSYRPFAEEVFADPAPAGDFQLTGQDDRPLRLADLRGRVVLLAFGFTHCPNVCPTTLANLAWANRLLSPAQQAALQVVFVSVDPARDTPARLRGYVPFYHPAFRGATGSPEEIARMAKAYGVFYQLEPPPDPAKPDVYNVSHSGSVYLVDKAGRLAAVYGHEQLSERDRLARDLAHFTDARP